MRVGDVQCVLTVSDLDSGTDFGVIHDDDLVLDALQRARAAASGNLCLSIKRPGDLHTKGAFGRSMVAKTRLFFLDNESDHDALESVHSRGLVFGSLAKRCSGRTNLWRDRWFVLCREQLWYCKPQERERKLTVLPLLTRTTCHVVGETSFQLFTGRRTYVLRARSRREMLQWKDAVERRHDLITENDSVEAAEFTVRGRRRGGWGGAQLKPPDPGLGR